MRLDLTHWHADFHKYLAVIEEKAMGIQELIIITGMNVIPYVGIIGIKHSPRAISEPIWIIIIPGSILEESNFPKNRMEIRHR